MIEYLYLGRIDYPAALALQDELVDLRAQGRIGNTLLLLEHPPVLTLGRNATRQNILASDDLLAQRGIQVHQVSRGGDVTYHGPGQLIGYPIFDLRTLRTPSGNRMGPVDFVRQIEEALIRLCGSHGLRAGRIPSLTGVWCGLDQPGNSSKTPPHAVKKIAAIGIHVSRGVTSHGFAFNLTTRLDDFSLIVPCGIRDHAVTSLEREVEDPATLPSFESFAHQAARCFGLVFESPVLALESIAALRARAENAAPVFPAEDRPLKTPRELEQFLHCAPPTHLA